MEDRLIKCLLALSIGQCDSGAGVDAFFHAIYTTKDSEAAGGDRRKTDKSSRALRPFVMLLGPHCSHVTESVAGVTSYWNIVQVRGARRRRLRHESARRSAWRGRVKSCYGASFGGRGPRTRSITSRRRNSGHCAAAAPPNAGAGEKRRTACRALRSLAIKGGRGAHVSRIRLLLVP